MTLPHYVIKSDYREPYCKECSYFDIEHSIKNGQCSNDKRKRRDGYSYCEKHQQEFLQYCSACSLNGYALGDKVVGKIMWGDGSLQECKIVKTDADISRDALVVELPNGMQAIMLTSTIVERWS